MNKDPAGEGGVILIDRLLGLLRIFVGEALTLSLLRNVWPGEAFDDRNSVHGEKREHPRQSEDQQTTHRGSGP